MTPRGLRALIGSSVFAVVAGCGDASTSVTSDSAALQPWASASGNERTLAVELTAPEAGDAGMIFSIEGPNMLDIGPASGVELTSSTPAVSSGRTRINVLVVGPLKTGVVAWLTVKGVNGGNPFTAIVTQVAAGAAGGFAQRADLDAYRVVVRR
jgi:hypothetical protein